jgi:hypothetical protein
MASFISLYVKTMRDAISLFWFATSIALFTLIPEFFQHIWEVNAGMFGSLAAFKANANDPARFYWAIPKIIGLTLAMFAALRFWAANESDQPWWSMKGINGKVLALNLIASGLIVFAFILFRGMFTQKSVLVGLGILLVATMPLLPWQIAAIIGNQDYTLDRAYREGWGASHRISLLFLVAVAPLVAVHYANHYLAIGKPSALVWLLMIWDSVIVASLALVAGTAMHHGFRGKP